ncbi:hypothetical protein ACOMHN_058560 [Nucella lapillus]
MEDPRTFFQNLFEALMSGHSKSFYTIAPPTLTNTKNPMINGSHHRGGRKYIPPLPLPQNHHHLHFPYPTPLPPPTHTHKGSVFFHYLAAGNDINHSPLGPAPRCQQKIYGGLQTLPARGLARENPAADDAARNFPSRFDLDTTA